MHPLLKVLHRLFPQKYMPTYDYIIKDSLWDYLKLAEDLFDVYDLYLKLK